MKRRYKNNDPFFTQKQTNNAIDAKSDTQCIDKIRRIIHTTLTTNKLYMYSYALVIMESIMNYHGVKRALSPSHENRFNNCTTPLNVKIA